jgi:uncharacterized Fe-S cluster-containing radical SAM superfamily protein
VAAAIDTDSFSATLRRRGIDLDHQLVAIARLEGSQEAEDISSPLNCRGFGRIRHFRRGTAPGWPENALPIDPAASALGIPAADLVEAQVFQNAVCNWRCWYCYVDFPLLSGNADTSQMFSADDLIELFVAHGPNRPRVLDLSGGQPDLVPEWVIWMARELDRRDLTDEVYLWSDDNLSNDYFWRHLDGGDRAYLSARAHYGKVCCFKGFDGESFAFNTGAAPDLFERQFDLMRRLVSETEIDLYCYATFTSPSSLDPAPGMSEFVDRLQEIDHNLPLRLVPLRIEAFTPARDRIGPEHERAMSNQDEAVAAWSSELEQRFGDNERNLEITDVELRRD